MYDPLAWVCTVYYTASLLLLWAPVSHAELRSFSIQTSPTWDCVQAIKVKGWGRKCMEPQKKRSDRAATTRVPYQEVPEFLSFKIFIVVAALLFCSSFGAGLWISKHHNCYLMQTFTLFYPIVKKKRSLWLNKYFDHYSFLLAHWATEFGRSMNHCYHLSVSLNKWSQ